MSDYICKTHQRRINGDSPCPYCEIDRLKAEMERVVINSAEMMQNQSNGMLKLMEENAQLHKAADSLWDGITEVLTQQNIDRVEQLYKIELALLLGGTVSNNDTPAWEEELHQRINDYIKDNARLTCEAALMEAEIARLKAEIINLRGRTMICARHGYFDVQVNAVECPTCEAERQLAEARAEIAYAQERNTNNTLMYDSQIKEMTAEIEAERKISAGLQDRIGLAYDTARQHAAREVVEIMGGWPLKNSTLADLRGRIIRHFGLEE